MAAANVYLVEMGDSAIASGDGDVLELDVHVVLGCGKCMLVFESRNRDIPKAYLWTASMNREQTHKSSSKNSSLTFQEFPPVDNSRCDLNGHDMALLENDVSPSVSRNPRRYPFSRYHASISFRSNNRNDNIRDCNAPALH